MVAIHLLKKSKKKTVFLYHHPRLWFLPPKNRPRHIPPPRSVGTTIRLRPESAVEKSLRCRVAVQSNWCPHRSQWWNVRGKTRRHLETTARKRWVFSKRWVLSADMFKIVRGLSLWFHMSSTKKNKPRQLRLWWQKIRATNRWWGNSISNQISSLVDTSLKKKKTQVWETCSWGCMMFSTDRSISV